MHCIAIPRFGRRLSGRSSRSNHSYACASSGSTTLASHRQSWMRHVVRRIGSPDPLIVSCTWMISASPIWMVVSSRISRARQLRISSPSSCPPPGSHHWLARRSVPLLCWSRTLPSFSNHQKHPIIMASSLIQNAKFKMQNDYSSPFTITKCVGNNTFSYDERASVKKPQLHIPALRS